MLFVRRKRRFCSVTEIEVRVVEVLQGDEDVRQELALVERYVAAAFGEM